MPVLTQVGVPVHERTNSRTEKVRSQPLALQAGSSRLGFLLVFAFCCCRVLPSVESGSLRGFTPPEFPRRSICGKPVFVAFGLVLQGLVTLTAQGLSLEKESSLEQDPFPSGLSLTCANFLLTSRLSLANGLLTGPS